MLRLVISITELFCYTSDHSSLNFSLPYSRSAWLYGFRTSTVKSQFIHSLTFLHNLNISYSCYFCIPLTFDLSVHLHLLWQKVMLSWFIPLIDSWFWLFTRSLMFSISINKCNMVSFVDDLGKLIIRASEVSNWNEHHLTEQFEARQNLTDDLVGFLLIMLPKQLHVKYVCFFQTCSWVILKSFS